MRNPIGWNLRNGNAGTGIAVLASLQLVLLCFSIASAGAQPAVAQEREDSRKSLISQRVPVRWGEHRHVKAGKSGDALVPVRLRDGMPVSDNSSVNVTQQPETAEPRAASAGAENLFEEAETLLEQGTAESLKAAIEKFSEALSLFRAAGDKSGEARALHQIGFICNSLGEKQKALDYYSQALPLRRAIGDRLGEAITLSNIANLYDSLGEKQKALDYYSQALPLHRAAGYEGGEAITLNNIGTVYYSLGEKQKALDYYSQALAILRTVGDTGGEAVTLNNIGKVYDDLGEKQKALDYYNQALPLYRAVGDKRTEATTLNNIGNLYDSLGEKQKALDYYSSALPLSRAAGDRGGEALTLYNIAFGERNRGNLTQALTQIEASLKIIEDLRSQIANSQLRASYFATVQKPYKFYIDLLMRLHKQQPNSGYDAKALHASESARARNLLELLTEAGADIRSGANPQLLQQERTLQQQLDALEKQRVQLQAGNPAQTAELEKQRESLLSQYEEVKAQIRTTSPHYAALTQPQPLTLPEIQQQMLDDDTLLLEYSLGEERSYLWAVSKTGISSYELPSRADIEKAAKAFRDAVTLREMASRNQLADIGYHLAGMILKPAKIAGFKRLLIVSDGVLQYTPFAALPASITSDAVIVPLIAQYEIVNLPSASALAIIRRDTSQRQPAPKTLAVIADPVFDTDDERVRGIVASGNVPVEAQQLQRSAADAGIAWNRLPFTRTEAQQILSLVPETQRQQAFDFAANRSTATSSELSQYRIVHFATHGFANSEKPELSGVVLSLLDEKGNWQNGYLRLNDIFNLNLSAELVVLSACQTGLGTEIKGEGLVGLTRGFMYAGSPRVVVSLWSVNDQGTAELMSIFYQKMLKEGKPAAAALRESQLQMLKEKKWKLPYYWAAFVLQGEWR